MERLAVIKKFLIIAVWGFSIYNILALFYIAAYQIPFQYSLEWIEGAMMDHVLRILDGKSIYAAPSIDFVSSPYTPLYFYISALFCYFFGPSIEILRIISALSTASILLTLFLWAKKETFSSTAGIFASGLFASTYFLVSNWFFLARTDMLSISLFLWSAYFIRFYSSRRVLFYSGILMYLSIMTKQSGLVLAVGLFFSGMLMHRKNIFFFVFPVVSLIVFSTMILNDLSDGWFWYMVYEMPANHGIIDTRVLTFFTEDIFPARFPFFLIVVAFIIFSFNVHKKKEFFFYFLFTGSILCATYIGRIKVGGATNVFIPFFFTGALFAAILFKNTFSKNRILTVLVITIIIQSTLCAFNPLRYKPSAKIIKHSNQLLDFVSETKGDVLVLPSGYTAYLAGKIPSAHTCLINDMLRNKSRKKEFSEMILDSFIERKYATVIVNEKLIPKPLEKNIFKNYKKTKKQIGIVKWISTADGVIEPANVFELKSRK